MELGGGRRKVRRRRPRLHDAASARVGAGGKGAAFGFALAAWTFPGLVFAFFTFANLFPRALDHHKWYRGKFDDYPKSRRAIVPFVL